MTQIISIVLVFLMILSCSQEPDDSVPQANIPSQEEIYHSQSIQCADQMVYHSGAENPSFPVAKAFGLPKGGGQTQGSLDVFVVGEAQFAIFSLNNYYFRDNEGIDIKVFENGFQISGSQSYFWDLGYVEISSGGTDPDPNTWDWYLLPPQHDGVPNQQKTIGKKNMIGLEPVLFHYPDNIVDLFSSDAGGDGFDLSEARKIIDRGSGDPLAFQLGEALSIGTDLRYIKVVDGGNYLADDAFSSNGIDIDAICVRYPVKK